MKTLRVQFILKRDAVKFLKLKTELPVLVYTAERERETDVCSGCCNQKVSLNQSCEALVDNKTVTIKACKQIRAPPQRRGAVMKCKCCVWL